MKGKNISDSWSRIHPVAKIVLVTLALFVIGLASKIPVLYKATGLLIGLYCGIAFAWLVSSVKK